MKWNKKDDLVQEQSLKHSRAVANKHENLFTRSDIKILTRSEINMIKKFNIFIFGVEEHFTIKI